MQIPHRIPEPATKSLVRKVEKKGILHRDIKPSNILVALHDPANAGVPKVIDSGIAKAKKGRRTDNMVYTSLHPFIGTPACRNPEQAEMSGLDIDTRSDIYSLGVLLYELLAGSPPFHPKELMASGLDVLRKTIREKEPARPRTQWMQALVAAEATRRTSRRAEESASSRRRLRDLVQRLRGDLDWIVMKCVVTAYREKTARVWDVRTGQPMIEPLRDDREVSSGQFSSDGQCVLTVCEDKRSLITSVYNPDIAPARVWDASALGVRSRRALIVFRAAISRVCLCGPHTTHYRQSQ